jgi:opacity protein-like surface antigen
MLKISTIAACALALSSGVALAQNPMPPGPNAAPGGAGGSAHASSIGSPSANVQDTLGGGTRSTTVLSQTNKNQSAAGMSRSDYSSGAQLQYGTQPQQAQSQMGGPDRPRGVAITDEYGNQYNSRGDKIGRGRPARMR